METAIIRVGLVLFVVIWYAGLLIVLGVVLFGLRAYWRWDRAMRSKDLDSPESG